MLKVSKSMFWSKNKVYPCIPQFYYIKVVFKGPLIARTCSPDAMLKEAIYITNKRFHQFMNKTRENAQKLNCSDLSQCKRNV